MNKKAPKKAVFAKKKNKNAPKTAPVAPAPQRELTRAEKTAMARDMAAKRNAQILSPTPKVQPSQNKVPSAKPTPRRTAGAKPQAKKTQQINSRQEINRKISTQTHARRDMAKSSKKVSGSIKNLEIKRRAKVTNHSFRVKKKKKAVGKLLLARLVLFFIMFLLMFALVAGVFSMRLKADGKDESKAYTLQLGEDIPEGTTVPESQKPVYVDIPKDCAVRYGNLYFPVSALSDMCKLTVTGTVKDLRYIPRESNDQSMRFIVDSDIAYVNGAKVRMVSPSFIYEGKLYVPLDFLQKYSKGLSISIDDGNREITVSKLLEGYDAATDSNLYSALSFNLSATSPLTPVEEPIE